MSKSVIWDFDKRYLRLKAERTAMIKLVVWDFDKTLVDGVLQEDKEVKILQTMWNCVHIFHGLGVVQAIVSQNLYSDLVSFLNERDLRSYFSAVLGDLKIVKSVAIKHLMDVLPVARPDQVVFIDDTEFQREEVREATSVLGIDPKNLEDIKTLVYRVIDSSGFPVTARSLGRPERYRLNYERTQAQVGYSGPREEFLRELNLIAACRQPTKKDREEVKELARRANQFFTMSPNTSREKVLLDLDSNLSDISTIILESSDKFGDYGICGALGYVWVNEVINVEYLVVSCTTQGKGLGSWFLSKWAETLLKHLGESYKVMFRWASSSYNSGMGGLWEWYGFNSVLVDGVVTVEGTLSLLANFEKRPSWIKEK